jgi:hypothetical protein
MSFICQSIQFIGAHLCQSVGSSIIVPKPNNHLEEINFINKAEFEEIMKLRNGNVYYEQSLVITAKYSTASEIQEFNKAHMILQVDILGKSSFIWGRIFPYNPVLTEIETNNGFAKITFRRECSEPEFA